MRWLVVVMALASACKDAHDSRDVSSAPSAQPPVVAPGSAGSAKLTTGPDPWAATGTRDDGLPSLSERVARANKLCPVVTGPYFFEVAKDGVVNHILGTRHVSVSLAKFPEVVRSNIRSAKLAVFEVAPDDTSGTRAKDEPLRDELGKDWPHLKELVGDDLAQELVRAPADTAVITMLVMYEDITNMLDKQIEDMVAAAKIPAIGLETAAFQDDVLAKLLDLRMLRATVENTKDRAEIQKDSADDLTQYCAGTDESPGMDEEEKAKLKKAGYTDAELDAMDEMLVFKRNSSWIPKFEELFKRGDVFVAVGADHLIGKRGVVSLLRARGFTVTRITH